MRPFNGGNSGAYYNGRAQNNPYYFFEPEQQHGRHAGARNNSGGRSRSNRVIIPDESIVQQARHVLIAGEEALTLATLGARLPAEVRTQLKARGGLKRFLLQHEQLFKIDGLHAMLAPGSESDNCGGHAEPCAVIPRSNSKQSGPDPERKHKPVEPAHSWNGNASVPFDDDGPAFSPEPSKTEVSKSQFESRSFESLDEDKNFRKLTAQYLGMLPSSQASTWSTTTQPSLVPPLLLHSMDSNGAPMSARSEPWDVMDRLSPRSRALGHTPPHHGLFHSQELDAVHELREHWRIRDASIQSSVEIEDTSTVQSVTAVLAEMGRTELDGLVERLNSEVRGDIITEYGSLENMLRSHPTVFHLTFAGVSLRDLSAELFTAQQELERLRKLVERQRAEIAAMQVEAQQAQQREYASMDTLVEVADSANSSGSASVPDTPSTSNHGFPTPGTGTEASAVAPTLATTTQ